MPGGLEQHLKEQTVKKSPKITSFLEVHPHPKVKGARFW